MSLKKIKQKNLKFKNMISNKYVNQQSVKDIDTLDFQGCLKNLQKKRKKKGEIVMHDDIVPITQINYRAIVQFSGTKSQFFNFIVCIKFTKDYRPLIIRICHLQKCNKYQQNYFHLTKIHSAYILTFILFFINKRVFIFLVLDDNKLFESG